jgi:Kinesin motor domain
VLEGLLQISLFNPLLETTPVRARASHARTSYKHHNTNAKMTSPNPKSPSSPRFMSQASPAGKVARSSSRMSSISRVSSDEDPNKTAVKVGMITNFPLFSNFHTLHACTLKKVADDCVSAIRVRPPLEPGQPGYELVPQRFQRSIVQVTSNTGLIIESPQGKRNYVFDRVFSENVGQEGVMDWLKEAIESFMTGYNVSLLAYGQSGAGKSYTMGTSGPSEQNDPWQMGISLMRTTH